MKALVLENVGTIEYKQVSKPAPQTNEVIVKVMAAGVCGSDIPRAYRDGAHNMPLIIGHEFAGVVDSVGEGVDSALIGSKVGVFPLIPCGKCIPCQNHQYEMCKNYNYLGSRCDGGFAEYVAVPKDNIVLLPESVAYDAAAMLEPMAVAVHSMRRVNPSASDTVVVCGLGTIGLLLTMFFLEKKVGNILVIGNKDFQKKTITELGIPEENYCDSKTDSVSDFISEKTGGQGCDVFFECVGANETVSLAVENTCAGGRVCLVGNPHSDMTFTKNIYWKILRNQLTITGTWNSSFAIPEDDWEYVIDKLDKGLINPTRLITHRYSLAKLTEGMEIMRDKTEDYIKVMCYPQGEPEG